MSTIPQSSDGREALAASAATAASSRVSRQARVETKSDAIREFHVNVPESELAELRRRINATRWPDRETVSDATQGVQLATTQALARYWATEYDWRKCEARLNALPQFITEIEPRHSFHSRPFEASEFAAGHRHARLARIDRRAVEDHRPADQSDGAWRERIGRLRCRGSVDARLWILRQAHRRRVESRSHRACLDCADETPGLHEVRGPRW